MHDLSRTTILHLRRPNLNDRHRLRESRLRICRVTATPAETSSRLFAAPEELEERTGLESRLTILGHLQRGGTPSAADRVLAAKLGAYCADLLHEGHFGVMVASRAGAVTPVPLREVAGQRKTVPLDHPWVRSAEAMGVNFGCSRMR